MTEREHPEPDDEPSEHETVGAPDGSGRPAQGLTLSIDTTEFRAAAGKTWLPFPGVMKSLQETSAISEHIAQRFAAQLGETLTETLAPVLTKISKTIFSADFSGLIESLKRHTPPNWPSGIDFDRLVEVIRDDGLPMAWVPRAEIVQQILDATDREARVSVLIRRIPELMEDCRAVLGHAGSADLSGQWELAGRAVEAFEQGHHEAAQALAVAVAESAATRHLGSYSVVRDLTDVDWDDVELHELRMMTALAPMRLFYTPWYPGDPPLPALSRHVSVHQAEPDHYTRGNALVAVLLVTSVLRALQEFFESADDGGTGDDALSP